MGAEDGGGGRRVAAAAAASRRKTVTAAMGRCRRFRLLTRAEDPTLRSRSPCRWMTPAGRRTAVTAAYRRRRPRTSTSGRDPRGRRRRRRRRRDGHGPPPPTAPPPPACVTDPRDKFGPSVTVAITADDTGRPSNGGDGGIPPASAAHLDFRARPTRPTKTTTTTAMGRRRRKRRRRLFALLTRATNPVLRSRSPLWRMTPAGRRTGATAAYHQRQPRTSTSGRGRRGRRRRRRRRRRPWAVTVGHAAACLRY